MNQTINKNQCHVSDIYKRLFFAVHSRRDLCKKHYFIVDFLMDLLLKESL